MYTYTVHVIKPHDFKNDRTKIWDERENRILCQCHLYLKSYTNPRSLSFEVKMILLNLLPPQVSKG